MRIRKTYHNLQPELLYYQMRNLFSHHGLVKGTDKLETFSNPANSTSTIYQGTLTFKNSSDKECIKAIMQGTMTGETKLALDVDEEAMDAKLVAAIQEDLDFFMSGFEANSEDEE